MLEFADEDFKTNIKSRFKDLKKIEYHWEIWAKNKIIK